MIAPCLSLWPGERPCLTGALESNGKPHDLWAATSTRAMRASGEAGSPALMQTHSRSVSLASLSSTASSRPGAALLSPRAIASLVALAVHGIWQEKLLVRGQQEGAERHALSSAPLLVAVECVFCTLAAAATILLKSKGAGVARPRPLSMSIARLNVLVAACDFASKVCLYTALQYVSYTSQSLSRASHAALVVGIGRSVLSKGHATAWFAPSLVLFGCAPSFLPTVSSLSCQAKQMGGVRRHTDTAICELCRRRVARGRRHQRPHGRLSRTVIERRSFLP